MHGVGHGDATAELPCEARRMRAVRCHELVGPSGLRVDELPNPEPGPSEIAIDVRAAGVNFPDVLITEGKYQFKPTPPFIPGGEVAGVVAAVGEGVTGFAVGDRVAATMLFSSIRRARRRSAPSGREAPR